MAEYNDPIWWHKNSPARGEFDNAPDLNIYLEFSEDSKVEQWTACALEPACLGPYSGSTTKDLCKLGQVT